MEGYVLITGATSGIGKAFAYEYAKNGHPLIITGLIENLVEDISNDLKTNYGIDVQIFVGDLTLNDNISKLISLIEQTKIHVLINNAGFGLSKSFLNESFMNLQKMIDLHIVCLTRLTKAVLPQMIERNNGTIINVSSLAGLFPFPRHNIYAGTKAYIKQFTECLYIDLLNTNIKLQVLCPGATKTDIRNDAKISEDTIKNSIGIHYETPEQVVAQSMKSLEKGEVICLCGGFLGRMQTAMAYMMPKKMYYKTILRFFPK